MSGSITTRASAYSIAPSAKRGRGRPRKKPRSPTPSPQASSSSTTPRPVKRRKVRRVSTPVDDNVFIIKDIIDEKLVKGKRFFKIDWEDNSATGESFEPTWEPEENANEEAVEDWEWEKQRQVLLSASLNLNQCQSPAPEASSESLPTNGISIELPLRSELLKVKPEFDTDSIACFPSSQLSHFTLSDTELPPSQFWVPSSQPSQDAIVLDSQPAFTASDQAVAVTKSAARISQTTIPDSQEFFNDLSQNLVEVPDTADISEDNPEEEFAILQIGHKESSGSSIPSHQPDDNPVFYAQDLRANDLINPSLHCSQTHHSSTSFPPVVSVQQGTQSDPFGSFLSQPAFEPGEFIVSAESESKSQSQSRVPATSNNHSGENTSNESYQAAQVVPPLKYQASSFLTQTAEFSAFEDYEAVPDSSLQRSGQVEQYQAPDRAARLSAALESQRVRSVMDELRAVQMQFLPSSHQASLGLTTDTETISGDGGPAHDEELLTPVSPSEIINSVEQDPSESLEQLSSEVHDGLAWAQDPMASFIANSLGPQHALDSHISSVADAIPTSESVDQAPNVGMNSAFAATPFRREFESRMQDTANDVATVSPARLTESAFNYEEKPPVLVDTALPNRQDAVTLSFEATAPNEYLTALPPLARNRATMASNLKAHGQDIKSFYALFARSRGGTAHLPDNEIILKIDALLQTLADGSNLPPYHQDFQDLSQEEWMRYARDTSSKLSFVYELLNNLRDARMEIIILAAGGPIMNILKAIVSESKMTFRSAQDDWPETPSEQESTSHCKVILVDTALRESPPILSGNLVLAYDESAESSGLLREYKTGALEFQHPIILTLIEVYSVEHINRRLSPTMDPLERRLAQIQCFLLLLRQAEEDAVFDGIHAPHDLAQQLAHHLVIDNEFSPPDQRWDTWEHQKIPGDVLEVYEDFRDQLIRYRKRVRDDSSSGAEMPKRRRISSSSTNDGQLSEALKIHLGSEIRVKSGLAQVSIEKLEDLVTLVDSLQIALNEKGKEVDDYAKTVRRFQPKYKEALSDRAQFEAERDRAIRAVAENEKKLQRTTQSLQEVTADRQRLGQLCERAQSDKQEDAQDAKVQIAERRFESEMEAANRKLKKANENIEYVRDSWRTATTEAGALKKENAQLQQQIRDLETRANDNIVEVHRMNNDGTRNQLRTMYEQERNLRLEREKEIERKNDEIRNFKSRFGGRETRGSSVPRSPRIRQMSSRNTSPVGDNGNGGNGNGGNGLGVTGAIFGPRAAHLRDG